MSIGKSHEVLLRELMEHLVPGPDHGLAIFGKDEEVVVDSDGKLVDVKLFYTMLPYVQFPHPLEEEAQRKCDVLFRAAQDFIAKGPYPEGEVTCITIGPDARIGVTFEVMEEGVELEKILEPLTAEELAGEF
jgi:hypothetical protein